MRTVTTPATVPEGKYKPSHPFKQMERSQLSRVCRLDGEPSDYQRSVGKVGLRYFGSFGDVCIYRLVGVRVGEETDSCSRFLSVPGQILAHLPPRDPAVRSTGCNSGEETDRERERERTGVALKGSGEAERGFARTCSAAHGSSPNVTGRGWRSWRLGPVFGMGGTRRSIADAGGEGKLEGASVTFRPAGRKQTIPSPCVEADPPSRQAFRRLTCPGTAVKNENGCDSRFVEWKTAQNLFIPRLL
ncbi:hypothetical protein SKAU_G00373770 [Synaphobranchus kaupii]|uniref:Uncharacterized protein n=1 Tax=Synaphobranchus kaupii TaxID=118154 RepID=A0A9Q1EGJ0_SYNKA|nr:hypothetical protein SKAU_G00373770 [Synaphobranchus kaupii]